MREDIERQRDLDLPSLVGRLAKDSLNMPTFGMGGGSAMEREAQEQWRESIEKQWQEAIVMAERGWPEATRILYVIGAELKFTHPRSGKRLRLDTSSSAVLAVLG